MAEIRRFEGVETSGHMVAAVVLAAGDSTRMGSPKALLAAPDGQPFVVRISRAFTAAGITHVAVVTGAAHPQIVEAVHAAVLPPTVFVVRNPDPSRGQLSSLWTGMDAVVTPDTEAVLMTLVDVPMLSPATVEAVVNEWRRTGAPIVRPAIGAVHGHPVLFDRSLFDELREAPLTSGAKAVVRRHETHIVNVVPPDDGCLRDIDTPEDYRALSR
jgi:molybdenum cofactor cytidylyltransferase